MTSASFMLVPEAVIQAGHIEAVSPLACYQCGTLIPRSDYSSVLVFRIDRERDNKKALKIPWNVWSCTTCGRETELQEPILYVDLAAMTSILAYNPRQASAPLQLYLDALLAQFEEVYPEYSSTISDRIINVTVEQDVPELLYSPIAMLDGTLDAQRRSQARRGKFGHDRVLAILGDVRPDGRMYLGGYELSQEFLEAPDNWHSETEEHLRSSIAAMIASGGETADPGNGHPHSADTAKSSNSYQHDAPAVKARQTQILRTELSEIIDTYYLDWERDEIFPHECAVALLCNASPGEYPELESELNTGVAAGFRIFLKDIFDKHFSSDDGLKQMPSAHSVPNKEDELQPPKEGNFDNAIMVQRAFTEIRYTKAINKYKNISDQIERGHLHEAQELAEISLATSASDDRHVVELLNGIVAVMQGYTFGPHFTEGAVRNLLSDFNSAGWADLNILLLCARGMEEISKYFYSRGVLESATVPLMTALNLYKLTSHEVQLAKVRLVGATVTAIQLLHEIGREGMSSSIARDLIEDERLEPDLSFRERGALLSRMATLHPPMIDVVANLSTGEVTVSPLAALTKDVNASGLDRKAAKTTLLQLVSDTNDPVPILYRSVVVGNPYLNQLMSLWLRSSDTHERMILGIYVLQVQALLDVPGSGMLAVAWRVLNSISECVQENSSDDDIDICIALAIACQAFVQAALDTDKKVASTRQLRTHAAPLQLWLAAERLGRVTLDYYLILRDESDRYNRLAGHASSIENIIVKTYPLALESVGKYTEAISVYLKFVDQQESRRAYARTGDIVLAVQGEMKTTYVRMSRCFFKRYLLEGDVLNAIEAAEALERHKARRLRVAALESQTGQSAAWLSAPLRYSASQLPEDTGVCCLGINPGTERIEGRWIFVGMRGGEWSDNSEVWIDEVSPGEKLQIIYEWFADRLAMFSQRVSEQGAAQKDMLTLAQEIVPELEVYERFRVLADLIQPRIEAVRKVYLSAEHYAFHLPWAAAVASRAEGDRELIVSVVPSCAYARSDRQPPYAGGSSLVGVIYFDGSDPAIRYAAEQMQADIGTDSDGNQSWTIETLTGDTTMADKTADVPAVDLMVVLSHGSRESGIDKDYLASSLQRKARCVLLMGCWSATVSQDNRHMEIEGTVTQFLESGAETVVASVWPLPISSAMQFGTAYAAALESYEEPATAFSAAVQVLRLSGAGGSHPAVWGSFSLYG